MVLINHKALPWRLPQESTEKKQLYLRVWLLQNTDTGAAFQKHHLNFPLTESIATQFVIITRLT